MPNRNGIAVRQRKEKKVEWRDGLHSSDDKSGNIHSFSTAINYI